MSNRLSALNGKKLYRGKNRMAGGVCSGIAEYFDIDPTIVRVGWIVFCAIGGSGFLAYVLAAVIMPEAPAEYPANVKDDIVE